MKPVGVIASLYRVAEFLERTANPIVSDACDPEVIAFHAANIP